MTAIRRPTHSEKIPKFINETKPIKNLSKKSTIFYPENELKHPKSVEFRNTSLFKKSKNKSNKQKVKNT